MQLLDFHGENTHIHTLFLYLPPGKKITHSWMTSSQLPRALLSHWLSSSRCLQTLLSQQCRILFCILQIGSKADNVLSHCIEKLLRETKLQLRAQKNEFFSLWFLDQLGEIRHKLQALRLNKSGINDRYLGFLTLRLRKHKLIYAWSLFSQLKADLVIFLCK